MAKHVLLSLLALALPMIVGCGQSSSGMNAWVSRHGGYCSYQRDRVGAIASRLAAQCESRALCVQAHVIDSNVLAAYSWPDGSIFVTRGLIDATGNDELAAAIAHEMGHLLMDGHLTGKVSALNGYGNNEADIEARADLVGRKLITLTGFEPDGMRRLLEKITASTPSNSPVHARLQSRVEKLSSLTRRSSTGG